MADHCFYFAATRLSSPIPLGCVCCGANAILASNTNGESRHLCPGCATATLEALIDEAPPPSSARRAEFEHRSAQLQLLADEIDPEVYQRDVLGVKEDDRG